MTRSAAPAQTGAAFLQHHSTVSGDNHGPRNFALASRDSDPDHHPHPPVLALGGEHANARFRRCHLRPGRIVGDRRELGSDHRRGARRGGGDAALMLLGSGLGLTMISPWSSESASLTTIAVSTAVWLVVVQWISSGLAGYMAGRLRTKWVGVHTDEVFFRDTAHGFLAWALATLLLAGVLGSALSSAVGAGASAVSAVAGARQPARRPMPARQASPTRRPILSTRCSVRRAPARQRRPTFLKRCETTDAQASRILLASAAVR